ncbi:flagellar biosynthetic protein FliO [Fulvimonas soli]|jgi:flagellar protein FliO/FliZ|uniref:Flagellar protein n=1 Tax=Fulvimonas soli TaxID=155197 RepID=A0A316I781_9GAMM|nr:flagellar biosynthetic protein FliO [Fulvimonas soli]PWK83071.1 flagellar protein FliO/FliZ [Fulvimonas soli]TNY25857.1 flagellar biosynthetic protein FliO [Fulvimonas soli]
MPVLLAFAPAAAAPDFSVGGELLRVLLSLAGIVALIFAAGWLSRRLQARTAPGGRRIRCVESFAVGARERILLIDADGKRLLVGAGQGGLRMLHVFEGTAPAPEPAAPATAPGFGELLARLRGRP